MKAAILAALLCVSGSAFADGFSADPIKDLEGAWYDDNYKVDITVQDGVVTVSKVESTHAAPLGAKMAPGVVLGRLTSFKADGERTMRFEGECRGFNGKDWEMQKCSQFGPALLLGKNAKGQTSTTFHIGTTTYFRAKDLSPGSLESRL